VSAVLVAYNEASRLRDAVESVAPWVDEVLVVDGGSTDGTVEVALCAGARVLTHPWEGYVRQKQHGTDAASYPWIFALDADERVDPQLGASLRAAAAELTNRGLTGAWVRRVNHLDGRAVRGSGWGRDVRVRLFDRRFARWGGHDPHDLVVGASGRRVLPGRLDHDPARTTRSYIRSTVRHARTKSASIAARRRPWPMESVARGVAHWLRKAIGGLAFRDGVRGWTIAWVGAKGTARAYRLARSRRGRS
jgi:glycosyltransferase involved in cell wall biosynthesis